VTERIGAERDLNQIIRITVHRGIVQSSDSRRALTRPAEGGKVVLSQ
jgi:hypothetical protein